MQVRELWRHPVKSLQGEAVAHADVGPGGFVGDREWGVLDTVTGRILTGRRCPDLLAAQATIDGDGEPRLTLPDGTATRGLGPATDDALSAWLRRPVTLVAAATSAPGKGEFFADPIDDTSEALEWTMPAGKFVDAMAVLVLTTASVRAGEALHPSGDWDVRRFRANVMVETDPGDDGWVEDGWCGGALRLGDVELDVRRPCVRCTMVTRPQPSLAADLDIFRVLRRHHDATLGVWCRVRTPGSVRVGDPVGPA